MDRRTQPMGVGRACCHRQSWCVRADMAKMHKFFSRGRTTIDVASLRRGIAFIDGFGISEPGVLTFEAKFDEDMISTVTTMYN
eukprot:2519285-Pleurochrysis_carterae.AAC.1